MTVIYNEIPQWLIDWNNRIFTLLYTPTAVLDVIFDGAEYYNFNVVGNTIVLYDAPTLNLRIDYEYGQNKAPLVGGWLGNTLQEIYTRVYSIVGEDEDVKLFDLNKVVIPLINEVHSDVCKGIIIDETYNPPRPIEAGDLRWMMKQDYIMWLQRSKLTEDTIIWNQFLKFDSKWFREKWFVLVNGNVIEYISNNQTMVSWISMTSKKIEAPHKAGSVVEQVYLLPRNATMPLTIENLNTNTMLELADYRAETNPYEHYQILYDNNQTGDRYIRILSHNNNTNYMIRYINSAVELNKDDDRCNLPENYGRKVIAPIVAGKLLYDNDEQALWISQLKKWYAELQSMYNFYAKITKTFRNKVKVKPMNFR